MNNAAQNSDWHIFTATDSGFGFFLFDMLPNDEFGWTVPNAKLSYGPFERKRSNDQHDRFRLKDVRRSVAFFNSEVFAALRFDY
jgi:hypothetical protein